MKYAYIVNDIVQQVVDVPEGFTIEDMFHPSIVSMYETVPNNVQIGWIRKGSNWTDSYNS